jgi:hypothetical protein
MKLRPSIGPKAGLVRRVEQLKKIREAEPYVYKDAPTLSFIVCCFNDSRTAKSIIDRLRAAGVDELVVCQSGVSDRADRAWMLELTRPNDFLVRWTDTRRMHDLGNALKFARGDLICISRDDEVHEDAAIWIAQALSLFQGYPRLGILGGRNGYISVPGERPKMAEALAIYGSQSEGSGQQGIEQIPLRDPASGVPFMFVEGVRASPIFYRREVVLALSGFDPKLSRCEGQSSVANHDICKDAWLAGWYVGLFGSATRRESSASKGTAVLKRRKRAGDGKVNSPCFESGCARSVPHISSLITDLNAALCA